MVDNLLCMTKFSGTGGADFGKWKTKILSIAKIKGKFD